VTRAITSIDELAWTPIRYPNAIYDHDEQRWISDAEVAEVPFTAFTSRRHAEHITARLIVRRVRQLNPTTATRGGQEELFAVYRYHAVFTDSPEPMLAAEATHRDHAIIEQVIADLKDSALAHLSSGHFNGTVAQREDVVRHARCVHCIRRFHPVLPPPSAFTGFRFPREVIVLAVRWYLRYGLSYRDVEELLAERGVQVDHVTIYRWVQRFTPLLIDAARLCRHATGDRWFVDETYVKIAGRWVYLYRAIDQFGQVIDVLVAEKRDMAATRRFFTRALEHRPSPTDVTTDRAAAYPRVLDELVPAARHVTEQYANNAIEADHGRLKSRLRPMRGLKQLRCARVISAGHAFIQNIRRGHYELGTEEVVNLRVLAAFDELALAI
jgi:transposase-like protein